MKLWLIVWLGSVVEVLAPLNPMPNPMAPRAGGFSVPAPLAYRVQWDYPWAIAVQFEVWSSTDLKTWALARTTTNREAIFLSRDREFFKVRALDPITGDYSGWATVGGKSP